jgi:hypothetical protein
LPIATAEQEDEEANRSTRLKIKGTGKFNAVVISEEVVPKLSNRAEKLRRQGVMMKDTATVLLCHDMTRRRKSRMILELSIPKPGGHVLSPEFDQVRGGPRSRWA